ncbi:hypothetical protein ACFQS6_24265 [Xanthomonas populi]
MALRLSMTMLRADKALCVAAARKIAKKNPAEAGFSSRQPRSVDQNL